jgi:hypothetical protein
LLQYHTEEGNPIMFAILLSLVCASIASVAPGTDVSGDLAITTWTSAGNPYAITDSTTVPAGGTLTIEPGVQITFADSAHLAVHGAIHVRGTKSDSVLIDLNGAPGFTIDGDSSSFAYARISGGNPQIPETIDAIARRWLLSESELRQLAYGGALSIRETAVSLTNCVLSGNTAASYVASNPISADPTSVSMKVAGYLPPYYVGTGGAVFAYDSARVYLDSCSFVSNISPRGAAVAVMNGSTLRMNRCVFSKNEGKSEHWYTPCYRNRGGEGVVYGAKSDLRITSCTFADNMAFANGWIPVGDDLERMHGTFELILNSCRTRVAESILWNDHDDESCHSLSYGVGYQWGVLPDTTSVTYSNVAGGWEGEGNIDADPRFLDRDAGDYRLGMDSPCYDTGDPDESPDPDGTRRDMGAIPRYHTTAVLATATPRPLRLNVSPNPFNSSTSILYTLPSAGDVGVRVYGITGQLVKTLVDRDHIAGAHSVTWNGRDSRGRNAASGVYLCRLTTLDGNRVTRIMLVR